MSHKAPDQHSEAKRAKLGLSVTSRERLPLLYRLLAGNVNDRTTPVPHLQALLVRARMALRLRRAGLTYSVDRVLFEFAPLTAVYQRFADGSQVARLGLLTACQQEVLAALPLSDASRYLTNSPLLLSKLPSAAR